MRARAFAVVVGCDRFDRYPSLRAAEDDASRIGSFLVDPQRGGFEVANVRVLRSPTLDVVKGVLSETAARAAADPGGFCLWYVASHGVPGGREGVQILFQDADPSNLTFSSLSLRDVARLFAEHRPAGSITVLDLCHAGAHGAGAADLALNEVWADHSPLADGHFVLAACAADETTGENVGGGRFTQALLELVETIGKERPHEPEILVSEVATGLTSRAAAGPRRNPTWTGIAVSKPVALSFNPYFDPAAPRPPAALSVEAIPAGDRSTALEFARMFASPMVRVGTGHNWCREATSVLLQIPSAACSDVGKRLTASRLAENAGERVQSFGNEGDAQQLIEVLSAAAVVLGGTGGLDGAEIRQLAYDLSRIANTTMALVSGRPATADWCESADGPAAIALAPIRFWKALGEAAFIALGCGLIGLEQQERSMASMILASVTANPSLWRLEWAGQYPDLSAVLGYVARQDKEVARQLVTRLLDRSLSDEKQGFRAAPASLTADRLGRELATKYAPVRRQADLDETADEILPLLLMMSWVCGESAVALNSRVASLLRSDCPSICLYVPNTVQATFARAMSDCTIHEWVRSSTPSLAQMVDGFRTMHRGPLSADPNRQRAEVFATYAAGRVFRNRSSFWVFSALASAAPL